ncbi:NADH-quinone oxidoreductase subunit E [Mycolicibacter hiberniae]|uniref:NADH-quinone oxidoreductase subunit E n=2 Tax=Mycolicibacter hiberniae TaxID=29314 RepID=A0A7I7X305_9MYCO|nr:NADH-quinone oxidoreductase subunit E [Mycolicibacter hiberniae]
MSAAAGEFDRAGVNKTGRGRLMPPTAGTDGNRVFLQLGRQPEEPNQFNYPDAPTSYAPDVRARLEADAKEIIGRYPQPRSAILPLLHLVQAQDTYITPAGLAFVAELLGLTSADVSGVASFYSMYRRDPTGKYLVGVCTNTLCAVMGGDAIYDELKSHLGVGNDQTTEDGAITLQHIECNAACDYAPVVMVNWEFFDNQTPESARELVDKLRDDAEVRPTRGMPLCSFAANERILAGFPDERPDDGQGGAGAATLAGLQVAREHGMTAPEPDANTRGGEK